MLQRQLRLPARQKLSQPQSQVNYFFVCKYAPNGLTYSRFGFVVSKNIDKRAVIRNRTKRVLRSMIEERLEKIASGYDVLFILRKPIEQRTMELEKILVSSLSKLISLRVNVQ